jgi:5-methyltetrahydrofolate--homocysteine methyltransferase
MTNDEFLGLLHSRKVLVADGATGTNLQKVGLTAGTHTEDWVLDAPDKILDLEKAFVDAGSDIILTCTFGATRPRMRGSRYADQVAEINRQAADLAHEAASIGTGVLVAGSMGPLGQLLKPYGPLTHEEACTAYAEQALALAAGGVQLLVIETQFSLDEASAAVEAARSQTDLPVVVSFSYDRGTRTMMGVRPADVAGKFKAPDVAMVGANCGTSLENMAVIIKEYAAAAPGQPLWAKPNAGLPRLEGETAVYDVGPEAMGDFARSAAQLGAGVIGGCCGSTPDHVAAMARAIQELRQ